MKIEIYIWKKNKKTDIPIIENKITYDDKDIENIALADHSITYDLDNEKYEYSARIEKVELKP